LKRPDVRIELSERQILILALLLVILIATSLLYCVGLGSLVLRQAWRNTPFPTEATLPAQENIEMAPILLSPQSPLPTAVEP